MPDFHLAHINIARGKAPLDSPVMEGFTSQVDAVNALAETSPGFVWRFDESASDDVAVIDVFTDPLMIVNMSVWENAAALKDYAYRGHHGQVFRDRKQWFRDMDEPGFALWWIPAGELPKLAEAKRRLDLLAERGPTVEAFTFREMFEAPSG